MGNSDFSGLSLRRDWFFLIVACAVALLPAKALATPPVISGVSVTGITNSTATITWTTDVASTSQVVYGTSSSYGFSSALSSTLVTAHSVALSNLAVGQTYHYQVQSADASGNLATLSDFTLTTSSGAGIPIPAGTWTMVLTKGLPVQANAWEQLVYVPPLQQSVMLSQYHQS